MRKHLLYIYVFHKAVSLIPSLLEPYEDAPFITNHDAIMVGRYWSITDVLHWPTCCPICTDTNYV